MLFYAFSTPTKIHLHIRLDLPELLSSKKPKDLQLKSYTESASTATPSQST